MLSSILYLLYFICTHLLAECAGEAAVDVIDTGYAKYLGNRTYSNAVAYLGVPYAEPPVGDKRFRAPFPLNTTRVAIESEGTIVDSRTYPEVCIQQTQAGGTSENSGSEDCLKVNVYAPVGAKKGSNLPVLVYFHGGAYVVGNPANTPFDHWIRQSPNVVIVSVYYRLSSIGFLAHPAFAKDTSLGDLNAGFLDQVQALKWMKAHIASFGGDPARITINGESAGASSVELHLVAQQEEGLYHAAIAQSVYRTPLPTLEQQEPLFNFYADVAGCGSGTVRAQIACLRNTNISALSKAQDAAVTSAFNASGYNAFHPVLDGKLFSDFPTKLLLEGKFANVPLIVGSTSNDTISFGNDTAMALLKYFPSITIQEINALIEAYPLEDFNSSADLQYQTITGDAELRCARTIMGKAFGAKVNTWTYRYNQAPPGFDIAYHSAENYIFFGLGADGTHTPLSPTESAFAEELIAYWLSFVRSGDPNKFKLARSPLWNRYTQKNIRLVLQEGPANSTAISGSHLEIEGEEERRRCALVTSQVDHQQN